MKICIFIIITILIFTNAVTDAPNAIATIVGTKVMNFKKAAKISAIFNVLGIIIMSFINFSVANCISTMINFNDGNKGYIILISAMIAVIIYALVALLFGIPTSETHGLTSGLTGATIAIYGIKNVNIIEWYNIGIGLVWSIIGAFFISIVITKILYKNINKFKEKTVKKLQICNMCGMSFMHGAQDGQKFIGILIIFVCLKNNVNIPNYAHSSDYIGIIIYTAIIMFIGISIGGKKIVENIGENMIKLNTKEGLLSDITTVVTLLTASFLGLPVSTTHAKTMSIIGVGKGNNKIINLNKMLNIIKAWIFTFPVCGIIAYILAIVQLIKN